LPRGRWWNVTGLAAADGCRFRPPTLLPVGLNQSPAHFPQVRVETNIDLSPGTLPNQVLGIRPLGVHWEAELTPRETGQYNVGLQGDGGFRISIDGNVASTSYDTNGIETKLTSVHLEAGKPVKLEANYGATENHQLALHLVWRKVDFKPQPEAIAAAKANVERYQTMVSYTQITAPFDGVITSRYVDAGALIDAQGKPLVRVSDNYLLRLDFPVTVDYAKDIKLGDPVTVRIDSLNGKTFTSKISRFTHEVDDSTRTMITEIEVPNADLELIPGMYATVVLEVEKHTEALAVPIEAVSSGKSPMVYVVNHDHRIEERTVKLGLETPDKCEVLSGLQEGDMVVIGNRSGFQANEKVEPKMVQL